MTAPGWHARVPSSAQDACRSAAQAAVLLRLYRYASLDGRVSIGTRQLARETHLAPGTVTAALRALQSAGVLRLVERGSGRRASSWLLPTVTPGLPVDNRPAAARSVSVSVSTGRRSVSIGATPSVSIGATITEPNHRGAPAAAHAWQDDGSGLSCAACALPARHRAHRWGAA